MTMINLNEFVNRRRLNVTLKNGVRVVMEERYGDVIISTPGLNINLVHSSNWKIQAGNGRFLKTFLNTALESISNVDITRVSRTKNWILDWSAIDSKVVPKTLGELVLDTRQ